MILPAKPPSSPVAVRVEISSEDDTSPLVREITGEPRRSYRISVPPSVTTTSGSLLVNSFTLWSRNSRDISSSRTGVLDSSGKDKLYLGGQVTVPKGTRSGNYWARVPVTISYE